jgi:hypothetical protein
MLATTPLFQFLLVLIGTQIHTSLHSVTLPTTYRFNFGVVMLSQEEANVQCGCTMELTLRAVITQLFLERPKGKCR